jgi:outer membrane protein assembly factor BamD (BamD/ComL family)
VKIVKWFLIGSVCLLCSGTWVRGQASADLYNQGVTALQNKQFDAAGKLFDSIVKDYPTSSNIDEVKIRAGFSYLQAGEYALAVDRLSSEAGPSGKPEFRGTALDFTALAQFSDGQKETDKAKSDASFKAAVTSLTTLIDIITKTPTPDNKGYLEQAIYYRALANYLLANYDAAEKDLLELTQSPQFSTSLSKPDYFLRLGSVYAVETNLAVKKNPAAVKGLANKALDAFNQVSTDQDALVQANEANMSKAEVLFLIAQLDSSTEGYEKALEAYRLVRRKQDIIELQQANLDKLKAQSNASLENSNSSFANDSSLLIMREENRLKDIQSAPDPIIQALIRMAECYVSMKQPDEARTILHRLIAHAQLTPDQQQEVDFQILYSYVLGGQTAQADQALTAYLKNHGSDPQADSISYQIAQKLLERKDYAGALAQAQRSLQDFPEGKGKYADNAVGLEAEALNRLGRIAESDKIINDFLAKNPKSPVANGMFLTKAQSETSRGDFTGALADYQKVRSNTSASPEIQAAADAGYIQTLSQLKRYDDVISEAKTFETQYPKSSALPSVMLFSALALLEKHDPGAVAALQDVAQKFPKDEIAPYALFYVFIYYQQTNNVPAMVQAANDLRQAFPEAYPFILQTADALSAINEKAKKFDDAAALYEPLTQAPKQDVAASASNKIGAVWLAAAKSMGYYQSMSLPMRTVAEKHLADAEAAYLGTLQKFPDQLGPVGDAFEGLVNGAKQRRSWGLLKDADLEGYLAKLGAGFPDHDMQTRFQLAEAGLVFVTKGGAAQYPAALDKFKQVIASNPELKLTRQETDQFGELLLAAHDYPSALKVYGDLLNNADPDDPAALGDAYYGLGATALGQGDLAQAKLNFNKLRGLPQGGVWHPHILDADYGVALADEQSSDPGDLEDARQTYATLMQAPQGGVLLQAKAMLGYGRLLEKAGHAITPAAAGPNEYAIHYYQEPHLLFAAATPEQSAEGLYDAGQAYAKAGDKVKAKKQYDDLLQNYGTTAPDWAAKAQAAESSLGT